MELTGNGLQPEKAHDDHIHSSGRRLSPVRRERILETAAKLFSSRDYHQVLMDDVAEAAGVSKGTIYRYFPNKEDLFLAIMQLAVDRTLETLMIEVATEGTAIGKLRRVVVRAINFFTENDALYKVINHERVFRFCEQREDLYEMRNRIRRVIESLIAQGVAEGELRDEVNPVFASTCLLAMIRSVLRNYSKERSAEWMAEEILRLFISGIGTPRAVEAVAAGPVVEEGAPEVWAGLLTVPEPAVD